MGTCSPFSFPSFVPGHCEIEWHDSQEEMKLSADCEVSSGQDVSWPGYTRPVHPSIPAPARSTSTKLFAYLLGPRINPGFAGGSTLLKCGLIQLGVVPPHETNGDDAIPWLFEND